MKLLSVLNAFAILGVVLGIYALVGVKFYSKINVELFGRFDRAYFTVSDLNECCLGFQNLRSGQVLQVKIFWTISLKAKQSISLTFEASSCNLTFFLVQVCTMENWSQLARSAPLRLCAGSLIKIK